tara:strand:- start:225 stop:1439 length:1215 start_codon:yes stop_codon:yes gene_type:complete
MVGLLSAKDYAGYAAEGKRLAVDLPEVTAMDAAKFIAEATPIIGDAMAAKEVWDEATSENPNWALVGALGGATLLGLIPGVGDAAAKAVKAGARGLLDTAKRVEVDPNTMGSLLGNVRLKPKGAALSPAQKVSDLLASGRADEITDEMLGKLTPNDNMELFKLYESGATGMDMPMDTASRLARASEQEAAGDYYSGSNAAFSSFNKNDSGIFASNAPSVADSYVDKAESIFSDATPTIYPLMVKGGSDFPVVDAKGNFFTHIPSSGLPDELDMLGNSIGRKLNTDEIAAYLAEREFDGQGNLMSRPPGVIFQDLVDPGRSRFKKYEGETDAMAQERIKDSALPSDVINVSDPSRLRSKFARFDPRLAHLRDLSAGLTTIPGGLLALQEMQKRANEEQQRQGLLN